MQAADAFRACLTKDPNHVPALVELASLANRRGDSAAACELARKALSIDTYDPAANYQFGMASAALGRNADAKDAFSIAALSMGWRSAANTALAGVYLRERRLTAPWTAPRAAWTTTAATWTPCNFRRSSTG